MILTGFIYGWYTITIPQLRTGLSDSPIYVTNDELAWLVSMLVTGISLGRFIGDIIIDTFGPKKGLILADLLFIFGWFTLIYGRESRAAYVARGAHGTGIGIAYKAFPMYVLDVTDPYVSNILYTLTVPSIVLGSLIISVVGYIVPYLTLTTSVLILSLMFIPLIIFLPESPVFLAKNGNRVAAIKSISFFKDILDPYESRRELDLLLRKRAEIENNSYRPKNSRHLNINRYTVWGKLRLLYLKNNIKATFIMFSITVAQNFTGYYFIMQYLPILLEAAGVKINVNAVMIIIFSIAFLSAFLSTATAHIIKKRIRLIYSMIGCSYTFFIMALYFTFVNNNMPQITMDILPVCFMSLLQVVYYLGLGSLSDILINELFTPEIKSFATLIIKTFGDLLDFFLTLIFCTIVDINFKIDWIFYFLSVCCLMSVIVMFFVPETKDMTHRQIQKYLAQDSDSSDQENENIEEHVL